MDEQAAALHTEIAADTVQLEELAGMYAAREITAREWKAARDPIEARRRQAERELARLSGGSVLDGYLGNSHLLRERWAELNLDRQRAIVAAVLDHALIGPGRDGAKGDVDPRVSLLVQVKVRGVAVPQTLLGDGFVHNRYYCQGV